MLLPWAALNVSHTTTYRRAKGVEQKRQRLAAKDMREITVRDFQAYGRPLESITSLKYLEHTMKASDDN